MPPSGRIIVQSERGSDLPLLGRLRAAGFVAVAADASQLPQLAKESPFDAILIDATAGGMADEAALECLRKIARDRPIVAVVNGRGDGALRDAFQSGVDDCIRLDDLPNLKALLSESARVAAARERARLAQTELAEREARYRELVERSSDAICLLDLDGRVLFANSAVQRIVGETPAALCADPTLLRRLIHAEYRSGFDAALRDARAERVVAGAIIVAWAHRDGRLVTAEADFTVCRDAGGEPTGVELVARDVSDHRRIEDALREPLRRLTHHVENAPLAVIEWDRDFRVSRWSPQAEVIFGWRADEVIGRHPHEWRIVFSDDVLAVDGVMARLVSGQEKRNSSLNRNYRKDGTVIVCEWNNSVLLAPGGELISILSLVSDVSAREEAFEALRSAHVSLEHRVAERTRALQEANERLRYEIAERSKVERALRESERFSRATVDAIAAKIAIIDENGNILAVNRAWEKYAIEHAADPSRVGLGANYLEVCERAANESEHARHVAAGIRAVIRGEIPAFELEYPCFPPGPRNWYVIHATRFSGDGPVRVVISHEDVTDRVDANQTLRANAERIRDLYDNAPCGYHSLDAEGRIVGINATQLAWLGYTEAEVLGRPITDFLTPEWREKFPSVFASFIASGRHGGAEAEFVRKDGSILQVALSASAVCDASGRFVMSRTTLFDVSRLKQTQAALRESEERYRRIVETSFEGICLVGSDMRLTFANRRLSEMLGYAPEEMVGRLASDFADPDAVPHMLEMFERRQLGIADQYDFRFRRRDGAEMWAIVSSAPVIGADGRFAGTLAMLTDITNRKRAERALQESEAKLRHAERLASIGTLAAGIAHEINNPVGSILLAADFALKERARGVNSEAIDASLSDIVREARRCGRIVRGVLQFARREPTEKWLGEINTVVERAIRQTRHFAAERDAKVSVHLGAGMPQVVHNPIQIEQSLINLIRNAIESGDRGVCVDVGTQMAASGVRLYVRDNGCGMTPQQKELMFDPFYTTRIHEGGTGLGLSIVHGVVAEHDGSIEVDTAPGRGTIVSITLPVARKAAATAGR